ncbi:MAG: SH3 domain-containing protein [Anaerolineae bacterium]|nr:SH3 domain-containing protein [Anaerolineae bacterium]
MPDMSASAWRVLEYLDAETDLNQRFPDVIGRRLGLDAHELGDVLHELAASGLARVRPGGWYDPTSEGRARSEDYRAEGARTVFGDYVSGDKVVGDKVGGDKIVAPAPAAPDEAAQPPQRRPAARTWLVAGGLILVIAVVAAIVLSVSPPATLPATPLPEPTGMLPRRPAVNDPALVATTSLEVRDGPGPDQPLLAIADPGARLAVAEDWDEAAFKVGEEGAWVRVRTAGEVEGWAAAVGLDFGEGAYPMPLDDFYLGRDGEQSFEDDLGPRHFTDWHLIADQGRAGLRGTQRRVRGQGSHVRRLHRRRAERARSGRFGGRSAARGGVGVGSRELRRRALPPTGSSPAPRGARWR